MNSQWMINWWGQTLGVYLQAKCRNLLKLKSSVKAIKICQGKYMNLLYITLAIKRLIFSFLSEQDAYNPSDLHGIILINKSLDTM